MIMINSSDNNNVNNDTNSGLNFSRAPLSRRAGSTYFLDYQVS